MPFDGTGLAGSLSSFGFWEPLAIVALRAGAAMLAFVPSSPILLAAGASQGIFWGSVFVLTGAQAGALAAFLIGRRLGYDFVARRGWMATLARTRPGRWLLEGESSQNRLMLAVLYCRLLPGLNLDGLSYVAGVTPIATWRFCVATFAGLLPYTVLLVAVGRQLVKLTSAEAFAILVLVFALLLALLPLGLRLVRRRRPKNHGGPASNDSRSKRAEAETQSP